MSDRFFIDDNFSHAVTLTGTELHHLKSVMRKRVGDTIELVNGKGALASAKIQSFSKDSAFLEIISQKNSPVPAPRWILAVALMRPAKLELVIEKCTELGVDSFWLYPADHSEKKQLSEHQIQRLEHIAISAMKQCKRLDLPKIKILNNLKESFHKDFTILFGDTKPNAPKLTAQKNAIFITGPEKGFSEKELHLLTEHAKGVSLHTNILRAETAPIAAICQLISSSPR